MKMQTSSVSKKSGFLLFEVLVAIVIFAFGFVATLRAFNHIMSISNRAVDYFYSSLVAEELLVRLQAATSSGEEFPVGGNLKPDFLKGYTLSYHIKKKVIEPPDEEELSEEEEDESIAEPEEETERDYNYVMNTISILKSNQTMMEFQKITRESI